MSTQKLLLLSNLKEFFKSKETLQVMMRIVNGESRISLRIIDWFVTNYAKMYFVVYELPDKKRFKVHNEYKLKLRAYNKKNYDPFCRRERIYIPFDETTEMETTIGQLNFFKWSIENKVIDYIETHFTEIEADMNSRNSNAKRRTTAELTPSTDGEENNVTRKKREELSVSACKCMKKEHVQIVVHF